MGVQRNFGREEVELTPLPENEFSAEREKKWRQEAGWIARMTWKKDRYWYNDYKIEEEFPTS